MTLSLLLASVPVAIAVAPGPGPGPSGPGSCCSDEGQVLRSSFAFTGDDGDDDNAATGTLLLLLGSTAITSTRSSDGDGGDCEDLDCPSVIRSADSLSLSLSSPSRLTTLSAILPLLVFPLSRSPQGSKGQTCPRCAPTSSRSGKWGSVPSFYRFLFS